MSAEMGQEDYTAMSPERLSPIFVDFAKRAGLGRIFGALGGAAPLDASLSAEPHEERKSAARELVAIAAGLLANPNDRDVPALFNHPDADVRMSASVFLGDADPVLAEATRQGVMNGCSAGEVVAARQRARQPPPPPEPSLQEISDTALIARLEDAGERLTACRFLDWVEDERDMETRNAIIRELTAIRLEAQRRGIAAQLIPLLDSPDPSIRHQAAMACLDIAPDKAVATLEALKLGSDPHLRAAAGATLNRWRARKDAAGGS